MSNKIYERVFTWTEFFYWVPIDEHKDRIIYTMALCDKAKHNCLLMSSEQEISTLAIAPNSPAPCKDSSLKAANQRRPCPLRPSAASTFTRKLTGSNLTLTDLLFALWPFLLVFQAFKITTLPTPSGNQICSMLLGLPSSSVARKR